MDYTAIDLLIARIRALTIKQQTIEDTLRECRANLLELMSADGITTRITGEGRATVYTLDSAEVEDWGKLYLYIEQHHALDLLQRRVSVAAVKERLAAGEDVSGVEIVSRPSIKVTL